MKAQELRLKYIEFWKKKQHAIIPHASLIPENDPTLLFVNSGMFPLMPYLSGEKHPMGTRLANVQPCFRTVDIESVGDKRHDTLFEMLGNWSLGDYSKEDQLNWWYEFLVEEIGLDINNLYQTVYLGDDLVDKDEEAVGIMEKVFEKYGISDIQVGPDADGSAEVGSGQEIEFGGKVRVFAYRENWWQRGDAVGELGGPDSETFFDTGKEHNPDFGQFCHPNCDCGRFIEIGNSVFMEYIKTETGWKELSQKNIDFGGGFERILMALDSEDNVFRTDVFAPLVEKCEKLSGKKYEDDSEAFEIVVDHVRAAVFLIADGAYPSNKDQGYYVRRIIRRAILNADRLGIEEHLLVGLSEGVISLMGDYYENLQQKKQVILEEIRKEEDKFRSTLKRGLKQFEKISDQNISGKDAFELFATYGFPLEMTEELAREKSISVDREGFQVEMKAHQELSRTASAGKFAGGLADQSDMAIKYHTATHLLNEALRQVLGDHVSQKGSNITGERLRFDFVHPEKLTPSQIQSVEELVNEQIQSNLEVSSEIMTPEKAKESGAMGVFDDKYGNDVKVYSIGDFSKEICGGPHVDSLGDLGYFKIKKEQSSSSGIRRIKAILE